MTRYVSQVLDLMGVVLGRRNGNDPDSNDEKFLQYLNDAYSLTMSSDVTLFENFGTLSFEVPAGQDVFTYNDVGASDKFVSICQEAFISLLDPVGESLSWNRLLVYRDPGEFYDYWGINNEDILVTGFPTEVLFYGNQFVFRTIPDDNDYLVHMYGYKMNQDFTSVGDPELPFDDWLRYLVYLACYNYAMDYRYGQEALASIKNGYQRERKLLMTKTHNQMKHSRALPRF